MIASEKGYKEAVKLLLDRGDDVSAMSVVSVTDAICMRDAYAMRVYVCVYDCVINATFVELIDCVYTLLGALGASCLGALLQASVSLSFVDASWGFGHDPSRLAQLKERLVVSRMTSLVIAFYPAIDAACAFSLIACALGNRLRVSFPNSSRFVESDSPIFGEIASNENLHSKATSLWRRVAIAPSTFMSTFINSVSLSAQLAGACGIIASMATPAPLQRRSRARLQIDVKATSSSSLLAENPRSTQCAAEANGSSCANAALAFAVIALSICANQALALTR